MSLLDLFRRWGATGDDVDPQQPGEEQQQPQQPEHYEHGDMDFDYQDDDDDQQFPPTRTDEQIWTEYLARIKPDITPDDPAFQSQLAIFHAAFRQDAIESVLQEHFAEYDVWRFLQGHVSIKKYPEVRAQQDRDTAAWQQLMTRPPWSTAPARASLAFKCTMMYFGLPVQPMQFKDELARSRAGLLGGLPGGGVEDGWDGEIATFVPEEMRPLRFLNHYARPGYGKESSHSTSAAILFVRWRLLTYRTVYPERSFEMFYDRPMPVDGGQGPDTTPMTLRGGQGPEPDTEEEDSSSLSIRGGDDAQGDLPLWGLTGRTVANFARGLGSFFAAVDRLLGLRSRDNAGITVAILEHAHYQRTLCHVLWEGQCLLGDQRRETEFLTQMGLALRHVMDNIDDDQMAWKICVSQISQDKYFTDADTLSYQPCPETHQLASFSLDGNPGALAYLFMPTNVDAGTAANHYQDWFQSLWRTLSRPDPVAEKSYNLGSRDVLAPQSCLMRINDGGQGTEYFPSDVGPPREVWEWLIHAYHWREQREFVIDTLPLAATGSLVHIPGYFRGTEEHTTYTTIQEVIQVAMEAIPDGQDIFSLQSLLVRPVKPGGGFLDIKGVHVLCQDGIIIDPESLDDGKEDCKKLGMWLRSGHTLHLQPRWAEYEAMMLNPDGVPLGDMALTLDPLEPWGTVLAQIRAAYRRLALPCSKDTIIRLDQRVAAGRPHDKNRTRWDIPAVDSPESTESWDEFIRQAVTTRQMTLQLCDPTAAAPELSNAAPFALRDQYPTEFYWGCHDGVDDVIALYEQEAAEMDVEQQDQPGVPSHAPVQLRTLFRRQRDRDEAQPQVQAQAPSNQQGRTVGHEHPGLQATGANDLALNAQGTPLRNEGLDDPVRAQIFREWSYGHPLSIHMQGQYPEIPVNAPPLEQLLKVPGPDGGVSDSVPVLSTQLMTATEQRRLQENFFKMRSLALGRVQECPFPSCHKYFGLDAQGTQAFQTHLKEQHVGKQCPFCHDVLLDCWAPWQVAQHFLTNHVDQFSHKGDLRRDLTVPIFSRGLVHSREEQYKFCPRCGRNHAVLDAKADRAQHDNLCYPGNSSSAARTKYCASCGKGYVPGKGVFGDQVHDKDCKATTEQKEEAVHCRDCGLPTHEFSRRYAHKHTLFCKGAECKRVLWCPWCGVDLKLVSQVARHAHLDSCEHKPRGGQHPIDTSTGEPLDSPRDTAELRRRAQHFTPLSEGFAKIEVPKWCPIDGCAVDLSFFNPGGLFTHFIQEHKEATGGMASCPICHLDFAARGWAYLVQKTQHLDDHIQRRRKRIEGDLQAAQATDRGDPALKEGLEKHNGDEIDPMKHLLAREKDLAHLQRRIIELEGERDEMAETLSTIPNLPSKPIPSRLHAWSK